MFHLRDTLSSGGFSERVEDVFSALGSGSVKQPDKSDIKERPRLNFDEQQLERSRKPITTPTKRQDDRTGQETGFKKKERFKHPAEFLKPERRTGHGRGRGRGRGHSFVPDFKKNPEKWTKYSLADVDNMTERSNSAAALQFLKSIKQTKKTENELNPEEEPEKLVFKKPIRQKPETIDEKTADDSTAKKPTFVGSKQVLAEYVVGTKPLKQKKKRSQEQEPRKNISQLKLSHLDDEEDLD